MGETIWLRVKRGTSMTLQCLWNITDTFTQRMSVLYRVLNTFMLACNSRDFITGIYCIHKGDSQLNFGWQEIETKLLVRAWAEEK